MKASVVIATKNRISDTLVCIRSIIGQTTLPDEIIVVDASDTTALEDVLRGTFRGDPSIRYIHANPGLTRQRNVGVRAATGEIIFFFDDDIVLDENFFAEVLAIFADDKAKEIGGVFGNIIDPSRTEKPLPMRFISKVAALSYSLFATVFLLSKVRKNGRFQSSGFSTYPYGYDKIIEVECVPGGLTAYRKEVFLDFEFDEALEGYSFMEDDDFSYRVAQKFKNIYTPYARVVHNESPASRDKRYENRKMMIMNHYYLYKKNLPQDLKHNAAFWWSVAGLLLNEVITLHFFGAKDLCDGLLLRGTPYSKIT